MHRAHELVVAVAPAHQLGDRQLLQRILARCRPALVERGTGNRRAKNSASALPSMRRVELRDAHPRPNALGLEASSQRRCRLAVGAERDGPTGISFSRSPHRAAGPILAPSGESRLA
jgi:hypothetical protein